MNPKSYPGIAGRWCGRSLHSRISAGASAAGIVVLLAGAAQVSAQVLIPGNDYLYSVQPTHIDFGLDQIPAIPGPVFGPGCQPFVGTVQLRGEPLDPMNLHTTDAVVRRPNPINLLPPGPVPPSYNVPIELVQLSLVSIAPISVNCPGGPTQWNVLVSERPGLAAVSNGNMQITHDPPGNQGRILSCSINVFADVMVVPVGGGPGTMLPPIPPIVIQSLGLYQWRTTHWTFAYPGSGPNFYPGEGPYTLQNPGDVTHTICPPPPPPDPHETWVPDLLDQDDTSVDFGTTVGGYPPIPADFFDPGSDPFIGEVFLRGRPLDIDNLGNTDTLIQRHFDPFQPSDPPGGPVVVPIEIIALSLVSIQPIIVTYPPTSMLPPELWHVAVDLSSVTPPPGNLSATKTHPNGGTYDAFLPVQPRLMFTRHSDGAVRMLDTGEVGLPTLQFTLLNGNFVHVLDPMISGMFYSHPLAQWIPGVIETIPGNTASQQTESPILPAPEGPARHRICLPKRQPRVCIYDVSCADGSCNLCPFCTGDVCQAFRCPNLTCPGSFSSTCGPDCCLEFNLITCGPPNGEPFCPIQQPCPCSPIPGACCDQTTGVCTVVQECDCNGTYLGDGTLCGPTGACCLPDGSCVVMDAQCCQLAGGLFEGGTCDPPVACCLPSGICVMRDPECCVLNGGTPQGPGSICTAPQACCINGPIVMTCLMRDPLCCQGIGGTPQGAGSACSPVLRACCLPTGTCLMLDPICCDEQGGVVAGPNCLGDLQPPGGNGIDDACETGGPNPPTTCPAPHDRRKNRYICFTPTPSNQQVAYRVDKTTAPTGICWVGAPDAANRSQCVASPVFRVWTETHIEVGDCEIIPVADFQVRCTLDGLNMSGPFNVGTILLPFINLKQWADTVGSFNGVEWTPPNQIGNVNDILAILARISASAGAPIFEVANLQAISSADSCLNQFVNTADVLICVRGVAGDSYGPPATAKLTDPNNCPLCP